MSDETISPLRRRMIEDMTVRNFSADTQRNYIRGVKNRLSRSITGYGHA
jgi:integrase/recombinase XerD